MVRSFYTIYWYSDISAVLSQEFLYLCILRLMVKKCRRVTTISFTFASIIYETDFMKIGIIIDITYELIF